MRFLVDFDATEAQIAQFIADNDLLVVEHLTDLNTYILDGDVPDSDIIVRKCPDADQPIQLLTQETFPINQDNWWKSAVFNKVDFDQTEHSFYRVGQGVRVYVADSGVNNHDDFTGRNLNHLFSVTDDIDRRGHGTAMAGVIIGNSCGITDVDLYAVKIFDTDYQTTLGDIIRGLDAIAQHHNLNVDRLHGVVNISWGIARNSFLDAKIEQLIESGLIVVCAAGNTSSPIADISPAAVDGAITVGSYSEDLVASQFTNHPSAISVSDGDVNTGNIDVWAPGEGIRIPTDNGFENASGTSVAAAIVSAQAAIAISLSDISLDVCEDLSIGQKDILSPYYFRDLLELGSEYDPSTNVVIMTNSSSSMQNITPNASAIVQSGKKFIRWIAPADLLSISWIDTPPSWITLDGCNIIVDATNQPAQENAYMMNIGGQSVAFIVIVYNSTSDINDSIEELKRNVNPEFFVITWECIQQCQDNGMGTCCLCCEHNGKSGGFCFQCANNSTGCSGNINCP